MRTNIIFHSLSGNLYIIAEAFKEVMNNMGIDTHLYRIIDPDLHIEAYERREVNEYYEEITALPEATNRKLEKADAIILGTTTRFGLPSAEMKVFLDETWPLYESRALEGKLFYAFSSSNVSVEDGMKSALSLYTWAGMMGLRNIPLEPYVHKDGTLMPNRPSDDIDIVAEKIGRTLLSL